MRGLISLTRAFATSVTRRGSSGGGGNLPELTRVRHPEVKRGGYSALNDDDLLHFKSLLEPHRIISEDAELTGCTSTVEFQSSESPSMHRLRIGPYQATTATGWG